eukprot:3111856-Pyramimonas_sp.AAC.1
MRDICQVANQRFRDLLPSSVHDVCENCGAVKPSVVSGRWDVNSFFPNADRAETLQAVEDLCSRVSLCTGKSTVTIPKKGVRKPYLGGNLTYHAADHDVVSFDQIIGMAKFEVHN